MEDSKFRDDIGREWNVRIDPNVLRRVKDKLGVSLIQAFSDPDELEALSKDPLQVIDILGVVLEPQIEAKRLTVEQWAEGLVSDALDSAVNALFEAIRNFSPRRQQILFDKAKAAAGILLNEDMTKLEAMTPEELADLMRDSSANSLSKPKPSE